MTRRSDPRKMARRAARRQPSALCLNRWVLATTIASLCEAGAFAQSACGGGAGAPVAGVCQLPVFDPTLHDGPNNAARTLVTNGDTVTLQGASTQILPGINGSASVSLPTLYADGRIVSGAQFANPADPASLVVQLGARNLNVFVPDPITGGTKTVNVYNNVNIADTFAPFNVTTNTAVSGQQYIATRIGTVDALGGVLNVNIGNGGSPAAAGNSILLVAKQSALFEADGTGSASSSVIWRLSNQVNMGPTSAALTPGGTSSLTTAFNSYVGTFTAYDGATQFTVTNASQLQAYNSFLIARLQAGTLDSSRYDAELRRAFTSAQQTITYTNGPADPNDEIFQPIGTRSVIHAIGANARGEIAAGAVLDGYSVGASTSTQVGAIMLAEQGALIVNNGTLSTLRTGNADVQSAMFAQTGAQAQNGATGVLNVGFLASGTANSTSANRGITATGSGTSAVNAGIINVAAPTQTGANPSYGLSLERGAAGSNSGIINVGAVRIGTPGAGVTIPGVIVNAGSFVNNAGGLIYLGRGSQTSMAATPADNATGNATLIGIQVQGSGGSATNAGVITIGTLTQNSQGILSSGATGAVVNAVGGVINVNGAAVSAPLENQGMYALNGVDVRNEGTINLNGVNGIGLKVIGSTPTAASRATSSGVINVAGALGATGLRNYGIWSEGGASVATLTGAVNLSGNGGIGVHARSGGQASVSGSGTVNFSGGSNQIGYFAYGVGAAITNSSTATQDVSTPGSVLLRIENGAGFTGSGANLVASGLDTILVNGTGVQGASRATVDTAGDHLAITGQGATGVQIDGGAQGFLRAQTQVQLSGVAAVAGLVDGRKHELDGTLSAGTVQSELTNQAAITSSAQDAVGFVAQFGGKLINQGAISLGNGVNNTGIIVRSGGVLDNRQDVTVAHGTGILVEGGGAAAQLSNSATVTALDGMAGLHIRDGAFLNIDSSTGAIVGRGTAHGVLIGQNAAGAVLGANSITTTGSGNGVENAAETGNVGFAGTTIHASGTGSGIRTATPLATALSDGSPSTVTISTTGSGAGFDFRQAGDAASPQMAAGDLTVGAGYTIVTDGGAIGIRALTTGHVVTAATVTAGAGGGAALLAGTAASSANLGTLSSLNPVAPVVDLSNGGGTTFINRGAVSAADVTALAVRGGAGNDTINMATGSVRGVVNTAGGTNTVNWTGGNLNGSIEMGSGGSNALLVQGVDLSTTYHLDGGAGAGDSLTFDGIQHRGGSLAADDLSKGVNLGHAWETINLRNGTTFGLTSGLILGGSTLNIDASSRLNAGGGVLPEIRSALANDPVLVNNAGTIDLSTGDSGPTDRLTIVGNYVGRNGRLIVDSVLNEGVPNSVSDKLVIDAARGPAKASGVTTLTVNYQGGGALSVGDGTRVVEVANGATTDVGSFVLGNRVAAGAYEYELHRGGRADTGGNPNDQNWYLRNTTDPTEPPEPPSPPPQVEVPNYRGEVPLDMAVPALAHRLGLAMLGTYHDRVGEDYGAALKPVSASADGEPQARGWGWGRVFGQSGDAGRDGATRRERLNNFLKDGPSYDFNAAGFQAGMDLWRDARDAGMHDTAGLYLGGGRIDSDVNAVLRPGKAGSVTIDAFSFGGYWTRKGASGWYVDAVAQGTRYDRVRTQSTLGEQLDTSGWGATASIEGGYPFALVNAWTIEPQAQLVYQHVSIGDTLRDHFGLIQYEDSDAIHGRLGARLVKGWIMDNGQPLTGWARINFWRNLGGSDAKTTFSTLSGLDPVTLGTSLGGSWGQIGLGLSAQVARNFSAFASIDYNVALGHGKGSGVSGRAGFKAVW